MQQCGRLGPAEQDKGSFEVMNRLIAQMRKTAINEEFLDSLVKSVT